MTYRRLAVAWLTLCSSWAMAQSPPAAATPRSETRFREAQRASKALEYDRALTLAQEALEQGDGSSELLLKIFLFQAQMAVAVGLQETAISAYARALNLDPGQELASDASPKFAHPFQKARERIAGARLTAVPSSQRTRDGLVKTQVRVQGDVLHQVFGVEVQQAGGAPVPLARTDTYEGHWSCAAAPCPHAIVVKDGRGNELLRIGSEKSPLLALEPELRAGALDTRPWYRRGWPYVAGAGVIAAAGTVLAVQTAQADANFRNARDNPGQNTISQVRALDAQRKGLYAATVTTLGISAVALGLGILWWSP
jgi:hypothetical protein